MDSSIGNKACKNKNRKIVSVVVMVVTVVMMANDYRQDDETLMISREWRTSGIMMPISMKLTFPAADNDGDDDEDDDET